MATLGTTNSGTGPFTISGSFGDAAGGPYSVPSPGIFVNDIKAVFDNNGTSGNARLYVWGSNTGVPASWMIRSGLFTAPGSFTTTTRSDLNVNTGVLSSDGYIPGGTNIWIGYYAASGVHAFKGDGSGSTRLGNTADGNWNDHGATSDPDAGTLAAWIDYTALAAPTVSSASPDVGQSGDSITVTGTSLLHTSSVTVNGASASFTADSDTQLTVTVPAGATPGVGSIVVTTPAGSDSTPFTLGQIYTSPDGAAVNSIVAIKVGKSDGSGTVLDVVAVWVPDPPDGSGGVKRIW